MRAGAARRAPLASAYTLQPLGDIGQRRGLQRREAARAGRTAHTGDACGGELKVDQRVVIPMREVVVVLNADDVRDGARLLLDLLGRHMC